MTAPNGRGYLLTDQARNLRDRFHAGISMASLRADVQEVVDVGHQVLVLLNACYGSDFHKLTLAFGDDDVGVVTPRRPGAHAISAGGSGELTWHDPSFGEGSIFFEAVLAALDGRADKTPRDGVVTVDELSAYLRGTISQFTDARQNPSPGDLLAKRSQGGFFFYDRRQLIEKGVVSEFDAAISFGDVGRLTMQESENELEVGAANVDVESLETKKFLRFQGMTLDPVEHGLAVVEVNESSEAFENSLRPGDVIRELGQDRSRWPETHGLV